MKQKIFVVILALLCAVSMITSCGGGGSSSAGSMPETGAATLYWEAPVTNTDGTSLTDLEGYEVHYGTSSGNYTESVDVGKVTSCSIGLSPGIYYITVTAYNAGGDESDYSNEVAKTVL